MRNFNRILLHLIIISTFLQLCFGLPRMKAGIRNQEYQFTSAGHARYTIMFGTVTPFEIKLQTEDLTTRISKIFLFNQQTGRRTEFRMAVPMQVSRLSDERRSPNVIFDNELVLPEQPSRLLTAGLYRVGVLALAGSEDDGPDNEPLVTIDSRANVQLEHELWDLETEFLLLFPDDHRASGLTFERFPPLLEPRRYLPSHYARNDSFWAAEQQDSVDLLLDKWQLSFLDTADSIRILDKEEKLHHSFASLKSREFVDGEMIEAILKHWLRYQPDPVREQVEFLPSEFVYAPPNEELFKNIRDNYLPALEFKRYYMMPFNVGNNHHWYLMVYNVPYGRFIIVDSNNHLKDIQYYAEDLSVFSYILTAFVGLRNVPQSTQFDVMVRDDGWRRRLVALRRDGHRSRNGNDDLLISKTSLWRSGYIQSDQDGYNCAIYTIMHALYLAEKPRMLNYVTMKPETNMNRANVGDIGSMYRRNMFAVLGAMCEHNLIRSRAQMSGVLDFPACIGVHDIFSSFLHR